MSMGVDRQRQMRMRPQADAQTICAQSAVRSVPEYRMPQVGASERAVGEAPRKSDLCLGDILRRILLHDKANVQADQQRRRCGLPCCRYDDSDRIGKRRHRKTSLRVCRQQRSYSPYLGTADRMLFTDHKER